MINNLHTFVYDGKKLSEFGAAITQRPTRIVPVRDISFSSAPFKSGDLIIDNGRYENKEFKVPIRAIPSLCGMTFEEWSDKLLEWLTPGGAYSQKIYRDTYKTGYYRKCTVKEIDDIVSVKRNVYETAITFNADPFLYSDIGIEKISHSTINGVLTVNLRNPEKWESEPVIVLSGSGTYSLTVNGRSPMYVTVSSGKIIIDKTREDCYDENGVSKNSYVSGMRIPYFDVGENEIEIEKTSGPDTFAVDIFPNWRRL